MKKGILFALGFLFLVAARTSAQDTPTVYNLTVFHSPSCHRCQEVEKKVLPAIQEELKGLTVEYRDITDMENYKFLLALKEKYKSDIKINLPVFFSNGHFLNADAPLDKTLKKFILNSGSGKNLEAPASGDLLAHFKSIKPLVIVLAGIIDGINPCAFSVIVFFMTFLAFQGYKRKQLFAIGLSFIFAVFLTYLLVGLGLFGFLYKLEGFWIVSKILNLCVGILSIFLAALAFYDFLYFRKTGNTEGLLLQLPPSIKRRIHLVIGSHYRSSQDKNEPGKRRLLILIASAFATGFLVSLLEAVCTGQTYLPTIVYILKTTYDLKALSYILLYNLMFISPLLAVFVFSLLGTTSGQFGIFLKKHLLLIKMSMAVLFLSLGILLIWRA